MDHYTHTHSSSKTLDKDRKHTLINLLVCLLYVLGLIFLEGLCYSVLLWHPEWDSPNLIIESLSLTALIVTHYGLLFLLGKHELICTHLPHKLLTVEIILLCLHLYILLGYLYVTLMPPVTAPKLECIFVLSPPAILASVRFLYLRWLKKHMNQGHTS